MKALILFIALALTGCATTLPGNPADMTPEQIKEAVKDKSAGVACVTIQTPYKGNSVFMSLDKGVFYQGGAKITVDSDCKILIENLSVTP